MRYPLLIVVAIVVMAVTVMFLLRRKDYDPPHQWVANSQVLTVLPRYRHLVRRLKRRTYVQLVVITIFMSIIALMLGAPATTQTSPKQQLNRDIMLCLDVSGSMLTTDARVVETFTSLVNEFHGERVAFQIWHYTSQTIFPLTDDYAMATKELDHLGELLDTAYVTPEGVYGSRELFRRIDGTLPPPDLRAGSLVSDGIASCLLAFPRIDDGRKRTMIVATDNEPQGKSVYSLQQSINLAKKQHVKVFALYSHMNIRNADDIVYDPAVQKAQLRRAVEETGGKLFDVSDPSSVPTIMESITSDGKLVKGGHVTTTSDNYGPYVIFLLLTTSVLLLVSGRRFP